MSVIQFEEKLKVAEKVSKNDRKWFPKLIRKFAGFQNIDLHTSLQVDRESAIEFSQSPLSYFDRLTQPNRLTFIFSGSFSPFAIKHHPRTD